MNKSTPQPWALYGEWQRYGLLAILFAVTTSSYFDYYVLSVVLEPIKQEFQVSDTMLGLLGGFSFASLYAVAAMPIARWADRGNRRTVIVLALSGWSVITTCCGFAQSFWQLVAARLGLGATEPGAVPPAQSLIADYFPPNRRGMASAILNAGSAAGYFVGVGIGGTVAAAYGWRMAFIIAGLSGVALALIASLTLKEPRVLLGRTESSTEPETTREALQSLRRKPSFVYALIGVSTYCIFVYGAGIFLPSFMMRSLHATLIQVSMTWGFAISGATLVGAVVGGRMADRLSGGDIRWYAWIPAISCAAAAPFYWLAFNAHTLWMFIALDFVAEALVNVGITICFTPIHAVCGSRRRTTAIALVQLSFMLIGCGFGPLLAGALSDAMSAAHGLDSIRYSLMILVVFLLPASFAFYQAGRLMLRDVED